jgi:hypothetical protein
VLSPHWVLTAGHNVDPGDTGEVDPGIRVSLHLPDLGVFEADDILLCPLFAGFGKPTIHHDLSLLYFADPLPGGLHYPALGLSLSIGDEITLAGYGRSGYGSYGYTTSAGLSDRRLGGNTVIRLEAESGGLGLLFLYDFDAPGSVNSLGNDWETIIAPGDSGGPALVLWESGYALVGVNTFTEGYGGRFGDTGGGVVLEPYWDWIGGTTGLHIIPEPGTLLLVLLGIVMLVAGRGVRAGRDGRGIARL